MTREFIMTPEFDKQWKAIGLADKELKALHHSNKRRHNTRHGRA